jgi:RNA polymerase sigma-70 factor (ECF subfamily)
MTNFDEIYHKYGTRVLNLAFRFVGDEETARDLTQDVFIKIYQNLDNFRYQSQIYTWIYRVAVNHFINYQKKERKKYWLSLMNQKVMDIVNSRNVDNLSTDTHSPDRIVEKSEREKIILALIHSLHIKYKAPLLLQRYENLSYQEIAETLNLTVGAVESRIHRAKRQLIKKLEPWLDSI